MTAVRRLVPRTAQLFAAALSCATLVPRLGAQHVAGVTYADQPAGIERHAYLTAWPALAPWLARLDLGAPSAVRDALRLRRHAHAASDGELNLLAQLEWQHGTLDSADAAIAEAVALAPRSAAHAFQAAMVAFAHLRAADGVLGRWQWQRRTREAYQRAFALDSLNQSARYYLAYTDLNTPAIGGGDKDRALAFAQGGIALGQDAFYAVRADAHRVRGELAAARADYDTAIARRVIKLGGLLEAATAEIATGDLARARRYLDWAAYCRDDASLTHEGLGDWFLASRDTAAAVRSYRAALTRAPGSDAVRKKLARIGAPSS